MMGRTSLGNTLWLASPPPSCPVLSCPLLSECRRQCPTPEWLKAAMLFGLCSRNHSSDYYHSSVTGKNIKPVQQCNHKNVLKLTVLCSKAEKVIHKQHNSMTTKFDFESECLISSREVLSSAESVFMFL